MTSKEKLDSVLSWLIFPESISKEEKQAIYKKLDDIEKDLEILEILRKCEDDKHSLYCVYVLNALSSGKITQDDVINVKEYLDGKD